MSLFEQPLRKPLAERMRPKTLEDYLGQERLLGSGRPLREAIEKGVSGSLLLFGPPGVGKTTLALLIAEASELHFEPFSAVLGGVKEVREAVARAEEVRRHKGLGTLLFVDEIHRFNKAQQDAFLPYVESGQVVLVGATTENPSFSVIAPLLSRCRVIKLEPLEPANLRRLVHRTLEDAEQGLGGRGLSIDDAALARLAEIGGGDARRVLTVLEASAAVAPDGCCLDLERIAEAAQHRSLIHDKSGDQHYDLLSAFHKSLRNSDVQASVYWLARMIEAGVDPRQMARRMIAVAAEDIGVADPMALQTATAAMQCIAQMGLPEGRLPLAEAAIYLAAAPKSNAVYLAIDAALEEVRQGEQHEIPLHLRNASNRFAREAGHGKGYQYAHDAEGGVAPMDCLPQKLSRRRFFVPKGQGFEARIADRMAQADELRKKR